MLSMSVDSWEMESVSEPSSLSSESACGLECGVNVPDVHVCGVTSGVKLGLSAGADTFI